MKNLFEEFSPKTLKEWNDKIITDLKGDCFESLIWNNSENIRINPIYHQESVSKTNNDVSHQHSNWEIEQTLQKPSNKKVLAILNSGATALLLRNFPSESLEEVLENVWVQHIQTSFQSNSIETHLDAFIALLEKRKLDYNSIKGSLHYDPLMDGLKNGQFQGDLWENLESIQDKVQAIPAYKGICIQAHEYPNAGATITQELAFITAQLSEYFANSNKLSPHKIQISMGISTNYFFEIAKYRAVRILWTQLLKAYNKEQTKLDLRAENSIRTSTLYDPYVNILRNTSQCMSAALGGANTINVNSFNAAYIKEDDFGQRIARNISLILKEESHFNKVNDPSAGSYYIEYLTNELSENAWKLFQEIEANGGWLKNVKTNTIQGMIEENAGQQEEDLKAGTKVLLGTNLYPNDEEKMTSKIEKSLSTNRKAEKDFRPLNTCRLSMKMDLERLAKEGNHA